MAFISIVPHNRELLVIKDMDVFASFFCYAKRQKKGLVPLSKSITAIEGTDNGDQTPFVPIEESEDADLLPVTNIGFRK